MDAHELHGTLEFLRACERLKNVTRTSWTSEGTRESVAEHTWRLCLMAVVLEDRLRPLNLARLLELCVIHDLGEAIHGDIPAVAQPAEGKVEAERHDLLTLIAPLPERVRARVLDLWDEYEAAESREARIAKALDKLETIMQHNQGRNPPGFDYRFNLEYGRKYTGADPVIAALRKILDDETEARGSPKTVAP